MTLDRSGFKQGLHSAGSDLKKLTDSSSGVSDKVKSLGNSIEHAGSAMIKPSLAVGGFLGAAVNTTMGYEEQMSKVQAISGSSAEELNKLKSTAREWGAKTKFSAKEAGEAMEYMAMA